MCGFLQTRSPDVFESKPQIFAIPVGRWQEDGFDVYVCASLMARGITGDMLQHSETGTIIDDNGSRVHIVKLYASRA